MQITVTQIEKHYATVQAVRGVSFQIQPGEIFALLGPNGAGKSSIIRMLVGMTRPDAGHILVQHDGGEFDHVPRRYLGYLPEDRGLYADKSVEKNLRFLAQLHGLSATETEQQLTHWLNVFELTDRRKEDLKQLSKGNQQKVQLIAAVIHRPALVILDEPFSGLDPLNQEKVVQFLQQLRADGMTVILSAHQMAMVEKLADHMLLMAKGQAVLAGTLAQIRSQAQPQPEVVIETEQPISSEQLDRWLAGYSWLLQTPQRLLVRLNETQQLSACLQQLLPYCALKNISMQNPDLHQLYLNAMTQHQQQEQAV
ncbi:ATP-binding cassette domain-containing protein [Alishewanella sp. BS5-314]|uniref:ABC transporter ATP-binding protein n=1 Tax=Alishewanella sp. BS5-314 TaxID=2755587 RepID=UPI0021BBB07F|nr:ATP-binding cassette domain-containing protein [Alishewanella sp. BS5-314]MCT8124854.1 ATP-binding cassette domain-containing protein [Alishewanella sp. BS5-314]